MPYSNEFLNYVNSLMFVTLVGREKERRIERESERMNATFE